MSASDHQTGFSGTRVALGVTGGIAAYKAIEVLRGLQRAGCEVRVCMTRHACEFVQPLTFRSLSGSYVIIDDYSPDNPDPIAHITFSQTIDLFVIAPATANTIAKLANGVADDFLTTTYLACTAPVLIAPAMNTAMWHHQATQRNMEKLHSDGVIVIDPDEGEMACGTVGPGRLSEPERIVSRALEILRERKSAESADGRLDSKALSSERGASDLAGEHILITTGATREPLDPVRFISNRSSGRMGFALAQAARERGAEVTVVAGATAVPAPSGVEVKSAVTAAEMHRVVMKEILDATVFIAAAAVSDYRPAQISPSKIKKSSHLIELKLERTADILADVSKSRRAGQIVVGFAAETHDVVASARQKLIDKSVDMVVANDVSRNGAGFDSENNSVSMVFRSTEEVIELPLMTKLEVAHRVLDEVAKLRRRQSATRKASSK